jgi:hypothetical protein
MEFMSARYSMLPMKTPYFHERSTDQWRYRYTYGFHTSSRKKWLPFSSPYVIFCLPTSLSQQMPTGALHKKHMTTLTFLEL